METTRFLRLRDIFDEAAKLPSVDWERYLEKACRGDEALLAEARQLLAAHKASPVSEAECLSPGGGSRTVGSYRILRQLGSGGMGIVYLAVRDDGAFRKNVAVKLLRGTQATPDLIQRFHQERQVLANLDHPNIARILDGGQTPEGLPYYVMEYVEGQPLNTFCDAQTLDLADRIRVFQQVVNAVHYLHENLVVHRDLKHSNILVASDGSVKLLDFGIAKVQGPVLQNMDLTGPGTRMLTPNYASPEQITGAPVSKASDIYSLGVILYEMLTGRLPHASPEEKATSDPPPPSANIRQDLQRTPETTSQLRRRIVGDLDQIVLLCLRRDPRQRYASAAALAQDLQRFLDGRSVEARKEPLPERAIRFLKRNRISVGVAAVILLLSGAGAWQAVQANTQHRLASSREAEVKRLLDELERQTVGASSGSSATTPPRPEDIRQLRQTIQRELGSAPARSLSPSWRRLLDRSQHYLESVRPFASHNQDLALEVIAANQMLGALYQLAHRESAILAYRNAALVLGDISAGDPSGGPFQSQWTFILTQLKHLGGELPTFAVAPPATAAVPAGISSRTATRVPRLPTSGQAMDRAEVEDLRRRLVSAESKARIAEDAMKELQASSQRLGHTVNPGITETFARMKTALEIARADLESGDLVAARDNIIAVDAYASKVMKAGGR